MKELLKVVYGSKLYGTSTPLSDTDLKVVYLPDLDDILLGKKMASHKVKLDALGNSVPHDKPMPNNGVETEYIPFQTFARDYLGGQTYALEIAFAVKNAHTLPAGTVTCTHDVFIVIEELRSQFTTRNVSSMAGFAQKQTFDYVHRGARLKAAEEVLDAVNTLNDEMLAIARPTQFSPRLYTPVSPRLDGKVGDRLALDVLAERTGLPIGATVNNNRTLRTLVLNGRNYTESTELSHLRLQLVKLVESYGERSNEAAEAEVDYKSLSHAVRVYQQAMELLDTGTITFPRPNADHLLRIKQGRESMVFVKEQLLELEEILARTEAEHSALPSSSPALTAQFNDWLVTKLRQMYGLN